MLTHMDKQEEQESIIASDATEILNEVIHDYELIYEQLKIAKEDITKSNQLLAIPQEQLKQVLIIVFDNAIKYSGDHKSRYKFQ